MRICSECSHPNPRASKSCEGCGASLGRLAEETDTKAMAVEVKKARSVMLLVVAVQVLGVVYLLVTEGLDTAMMVGMLAFAALYVGLWAWCKRNPLAASIVGLVVFVVVHLVEALIDPAALARGLVILVGIVAALVWAVASGVRHRKLGRER
jgi:FtsH-binding integral membrane protein